MIPPLCPKLNQTLNAYKMTKHLRSNNMSDLHHLGNEIEKVEKDHHTILNKELLMYSKLLIQ